MSIRHEETEMANLIKYPRTFHCPWSPGKTNDDKVHTQSAIDKMFMDRIVVVSEKCDGENASIYSNGTYARSLDSGRHESRGWIRAFAAQVGPNIPKDWRVCGENLYAQHSLKYDRLPSYFLAFGIYDDTNLCLSWNDTVEWANLLEIDLVPVLYVGPWDQDLIQALGTPGTPGAYGPEREGYVVRLADAFRFEDFGKSVSKWVRKGHVTTNDHWMHSQVIPNGLASKGV